MLCFRCSFFSGKEENRLKICRNCNQTYGDEAGFCGKCGSSLDMMSPKLPKAKMSKKKKKAIIITFSVLLALAAVAFGVVLFIFRYPKVEDMIDEIYEDTRIYTIDDMIFISDEIDIKINKQENKNGKCKSYCTVTLTDDKADRTIDLVVVCEKDGLTEWDFEEFYPGDKEPEIVMKEGFADELAEEYEINNLDDFEDESDYETGELRYVYSVDDYRDMVEFTGEIAFVGELEVKDKVGSYFVADMEVDMSDMDINTSFDGSYRDISDEPVMGIRLAEKSDNEYNLEIVSPMYGEVSTVATLDEDKIFDEDGNFYLCLYADVGEYTFEISFEEDKIGAVTVISNDYIVDAYIMEAGEFDIEMPEDESYITEGTLPDVDGEKIYIYSWNADLETKLEGFYVAYPEYASRIEYVNLDVSGASSEYSNEAEASVDTDKPASIIVYDAAVAENFSNKDMFVSMESVGITDEMYANAYQYNKDFVTYDGELMALTWQNNPGCFVYRSDIAIEVFGTDDPAVIQEKVANWDTFLETAEILKQNGYYMISTMDDITYDGYNFAELPSQEIVDAMEVNGYSAGTTRWSSAWMDDMSEDVFGYFGCPWFANWSIYSDDPEISYRVCEGPMGFVWGNSYLGITHDCPDKEFAAFVLYCLCCDPEVMYYNATDNMEPPNNTVVMVQLIEDGQTLTPEGQLGDQNPLPVYHNAALQLEYNPN